jgi:hypothetical protein
MNAFASYSDLRDYYERYHARVMRGYMPEYRIKEPANFWPVKTFAVGAMMAWDYIRDSAPKIEQSAKTYCWLSTLALPYQTPTFFVTPELLAAALRTELPLDLQIDQLNWPFPFMLLMLPHKSIVHPTEGEAAFVCLGRMPPGFALPEQRIPFKLTDPFFLLAALLPQSQPPRIYHAGHPLRPGVTLAQAEAECWGDRFFVGVDEVLLNNQSDTALIDSSRFAQTMWRLGLTLLSLISAEPKLVEYGKRLKVLRAKRRGHPAKEFWGPNMIGRVYRAAVHPDTTGNGSSTRPHWVRGHCKHQVFGVGRSQRKLIWIQPYRTGTQETAIAKAHEQ